MLPQFYPNSGTVVVGMSGGVDSSVTAALLKERGLNVIGLFMKNWEEKDENGVCTSEQDYADAEAVARRLGIRLYSIEFIEEYRDRVFARFLADIKAGLTPNPDILCNREIKFDAFYDKAIEFGADFLATGHYCRTDESRTQLLKGLDPIKDQTYFLHAIDGKKLNKVLFPVGHLEKKVVREIAARFDLKTKDKKDSTGICFIGERNFREFLKQYVSSQKGFFRTLDGTKVGTHDGFPFYTIGQRRGLGLGGQGEPWFVVDKDPESRTVFVERGETHPALYSDELIADEITWISGDESAARAAQNLKAKVRYRQSDQACKIDWERSINGQIAVTFPVPQRAVTPGQSIAFYDGDICLGGGVIRNRGERFDLKGVTSNEIENLTRVQ